MTFLESDQASLIAAYVIYLSRRTGVNLVTESACDEIRARYSGYKWFEAVSSGSKREAIPIKNHDVQSLIC